MELNIAVPNEKKPTWGGGGVKPFGASYGKMMMWFFIVSDALTFSAFLAAYGLTRFKFIVGVEVSRLGGIMNVSQVTRSMHSAGS